MNTEFLKPTLIGERFDEHSIPVEVLKDLAAFESLIIETAKWLYLQENQGRQRVPRGFADGFALHLSGIGEGSAVAILDRSSPCSDLFPDAHAEWFDKARERVIEVIQVAASGRSFDSLLPNRILAIFDRFGRSLRETEQVQFMASSGANVTYDAKIRKSLVLQTASEYRTEAQLRGEISELDAENGTLTFKLVNGKKIRGTYSPEVKGEAVAALGTFGEALVMVECTVVRDQSDSPRSLENITRIEPLDPLDVPARLEALSLLSDGWLDGAGRAPNKEGLAWLSHAWTTHWPGDKVLPYVYPTPEGGIQAEWTFKVTGVELDLNLLTKRGTLTILERASGQEISEQELALDSADGWKALLNATTEADEQHAG